MDIKKVSILNCLDESQREQATFIQPKPGKELTMLHEDGRLASKALAVRGLSLRGGEVIPFHCHQHKEKLYISDGNGTVEVFIYEDGDAPQKHALSKKDQRLLIPAGMPHAVRCVSTLPGHETCSILVVTSSRDGQDIEWQPGLEELLLNKHRDSAKAP